MQKDMLESHSHSRTLHFQSSHGFLEDPRELELENQGLVVGWLSGIKKHIGAFRVPDYSGVNLSFSNLVTVRVLAADQLYWSHAGAMRWLQGMAVPSILGEGWFLLKGKSTKPGDPKPGAVEPVLLQVQDNPEEVSPVDICKQVWQQLSL